MEIGPMKKTLTMLSIIAAIFGAYFILERKIDAGDDYTMMYVLNVENTAALQFKDAEIAGVKGEIRDLKAWLRYDPDDAASRKDLLEQEDELEKLLREREDIKGR
jgi:hypothetical protein